MNTTGIVLSCTFILFISVPYLAKRRAERPEGFIIGGRDYGWWRLMAGLSATYIGGAALLNLPSIAYTYGWFALADVIPTTVALVLSGLVLVPILRKSPDAVSLGTYLKRSGTFVAMVSGVLSVIVHTLICAAQILALTTLLAPFVPVPPPWLSVLVAVLVAAYIVYGGYNSVTLTDVIQFVLMVVCFVGVVAVLLAIRAGGESSAEPIALKPMPLNMILLLGLPLLLVPCLQDTHIRIHSAKTTNHAIAGCIGAAFAYLVFGLVAVGIGIQSAAQGVVLELPDQATPTYLSLSLGGFAAIPLAGVLAAIVSTLDSMLFAASASLAYDVPAWRKPEDPRPRFLSPVVSTIAVLCAATAIAVVAPRILSIILSALIIYVAVLLPLLVGVVLHVNQKALAVVALAVLIVTTANETFGWDFPFRAFAICAAHMLIVGGLSVVGRAPLRN